jgi:hypothetical protein
VSADGADAVTPEFSVVAGNPTPSELAAVTAVLDAMLEQAVEDRSEDRAEGRSAWQRSQRPIRGTISPGRGAWRGFSG